QAEDGIRDKLVTGVQTCALPISCHRAAHNLGDARDVGVDWFRVRATQTNESIALLPELRGREWFAKFLCDRRRNGRAADRYAARSEERRVGKECRSRWWTSE